MVTVLLVVGFLLAVGLASYVGEVLKDHYELRKARRGLGWLEQRAAEHLIVHTTQGQTYAGLVRDVLPDGLVMSAVTLVDTGATLAGDTWIPREHVLMVQRVKATA